MINKKFLTIFLPIIIFALLIMVALYISGINVLEMITMHKIASLKKFILSFGNFAILAFVIIFSIRGLLVILPCAPLFVLAGALFGPYIGFSALMMSIFVSSTVSFFLGKTIGPKLFFKFFGNKLTIIQDKISKHGPKVLITFRLSTVFPFDILNYACGVTKMSYKKFIIANMIGLTPESLALCFLGGHLTHSIFSLKFLAILGILIVVLVIPHVYNRIKKSSITSAPK